MSHLVIESGRTEHQCCHDLWRYRELFYVLAWRDISVRYKQTVIGVLWAVLQPLLITLIFTVVFGKLAGMGSENVPYPLLGFFRHAALAVLCHGQPKPHCQLQADFKSLLSAHDRTRRRGRHFHGRLPHYLGPFYPDGRLVSSDAYVAGYLRECARVLRPKGRLLLSTHGIWPYHPGSQNDDDYRWTLAGFRREIEHAGLQVVATQGACGGILCLAQQFLALFDLPQIRSPFSLFFINSISLVLNTLGAGLNWVAPKLMSAGDIVPICIPVEACKPESD
jgi:hypothetical protein